MLIKYNTNTNKFDLMGLSTSDLSTIHSGLKLAGDYGKSHKKLSEKLDVALFELEQRAQSKII